MTHQTIQFGHLMEVQQKQALSGKGKNTDCLLKPVIC
jgi:hypothetical protein